MAQPEKMIVLTEKSKVLEIAQLPKNRTECQEPKNLQEKTDHEDWLPSDLRKDSRAQEED